VRRGRKAVEEEEEREEEEKEARCEGAADEVTEEEEARFASARLRMVERLRKQRIADERVLDAMLRVKRHLFVPPHLRSYAYEDCPLHIGEGQTISAPHMVAIMCHLLDLRKGEKVLEVGAGSGYHAAVLAELVGEEGHVFTIERIRSLVDFASQNLKKAGYGHRVSVFFGNGSLGLPKFAPFDKICVTCASPDVPPPLVEQLKEGGKMVIPLGSVLQDLYLIEKTRSGGIRKERKCAVSFVPLIGKYGFRER